MVATPTDRQPVTSPYFSILIPSKDSRELLMCAIESVRRQPFEDWEIIVSDNASGEAYGPRIAELGDDRIRCTRLDDPVPVTENWNRALALAQGEYVVMLSDDDALAPGFLDGTRRVIDTFGQPDLVYCGAYHYTYPGAMAGGPDGQLAIVRNSPLFVDRYEPYRLPHQEAVALARKALRFHHYFSFNSQHFTWRRAAMPAMTRGDQFFKSPEPAFYAATMSFFTARTIVVNPLPQVIIGISPTSFGFRDPNHQESVGHEVQGAGSRDPFEGVVGSIDGSDQNTKWLIAAREVQAAMAGELSLAVGVQHYRAIQIVEGVRRGVAHDEPAAIPRMSHQLKPHEKVLARGLEAGARALGVAGLRSKTGYALNRVLNRVLDQQFPAVHTDLPIGHGRNILDAVRWLEGETGGTTSGDAPNPFLGQGQQQVLDRFHDLYYSLINEGKGVMTIDLAWLGTEMFKCPMDLWLYQEIIYKNKPDVIIETGTYRGGSALYLASICSLVGHGKVISVDIDAWADKPRPQHQRLTYLTGSSTDPGILAKVQSLVGASKNVLVILDSDHTRDHVLAELRLYQQFVPLGGLLIVEDTNVNGHPTYPDHGPGPWEAVDAFLAEAPTFEADRSLERFLLTMNPRGYLRRVSDGS